MTQDSDLGPKPDARIEPGEPNPGGPDALDQVDTDPEGNELPLEAHDLDPDNNPAVDDAPEETREGEDTSTEATRGDGAVSEDTEEDSA